MKNLLYRKKIAVGHTNVSAANLTTKMAEHLTHILFLRIQKGVLPNSFKESYNS